MWQCAGVFLGRFARAKTNSSKSPHLDVNHTPHLRVCICVFFVCVRVPDSGFMHLFHEAEESFAEFLAAHDGHFHFPLVHALVLIGFLLMFVTEVAVEHVSMKSTTSSVGLGRMNATKSVRMQLLKKNSSATSVEGLRLDDDDEDDDVDDDELALTQTAVAGRDARKSSRRRSKTQVYGLLDGTMRADASAVATAEDGHMHGGVASTHDHLLNVALDTGSSQSSAVILSLALAVHSVRSSSVCCC